MMEHQWSHDTHLIDITTRHRAEMIELVSAALPDGAGREVLAHRIEAKHAQARLLRRTVINRDPDDAQWAKLRADALISECTSILIAPTSS